MTHAEKDAEILLLKLQVTGLQNQLTRVTNDHLHQVKQARLLKERLDMPIERVRAYDQVNELLSKIRLLEDKCKSGEKYSHYKGGIYEKICEAKLEEDINTTVVIYKNANGDIFSRPATDFYGTVELTSWTIPRFTPIK